MSDLPFRETSRDRRVATWLIVGLAVLFGGLYVLAYVASSDKVPMGTTVAGIEIGGRDPESARAVLAEGLDDRMDRPITVSADGRRARIEPARAGLDVDLVESVRQAGGGRSWHPSRMWDYFTGGDDFHAVLAVDDVALGKAIDRFATKVDEKTKEGRVVFDKGRARPHYPEPGQAIDRERAAAAISDAFLRTDEVVPLPVERIEPEVSEEKVRAAMEDFANPAMSAPVVIVLAEKNIVLRPEAYSDALSLKAQNGTLVPRLDEKALLAAIEPAMKTVALAPKDATVRLVNGEPTVVPSKRGVTFEPKDITDQFLSLVVQRGRNRTLEVESVVDKPDFTTRQARNLEITEVVSEFTTHYPHSDYRNINLGRAAELINGTLLKPGETFSLNDTVGERTRENGFTEGFVISDGVYKEDFGGGVSQVATTTFNAAFFAGLEDVEHKPHSFYIDRYPIGREATVAWGAVDLKFKNDTPYGILVQAGIRPSTPSSQGSMTVRMWSTKYWDITAGVSQRYNFTKEETRYIDDEDCVPNDGYGGFEVDVYRYFRKAGSDRLVRTETMHTTYLPSDTVICGKDPNA